MRKVTVKLKDGRSMDADFVSASADKLELSIAGNHVTIAMDEVAAIIFSLETTAVKAVPTQQELCESVVKSLRKLAGATEVGITFADYSRRLVDVKNEVDEPLAAIENSYLKSELTEALDDYVKAGRFWNSDIQAGWTANPSFWWIMAKAHLDQAASFKPFSSASKPKP